MSVAKTVSRVSGRFIAVALWHRVTSGAIVPYVTRQVQVAGRSGLAGVALVVFAIAFFVGANSFLKH